MNKLLAYLVMFLTPALLTFSNPLLAEGVRSETGLAQGKRPRICLVLSGGGARGAAHVGVLRVLEELRVPVDCIAGTSMGSLVGAAMATGFTLQEMDELLAGISTELLFEEKPPRQEQSMRRKQDDYSILVTPEVGLKDGQVKVGKGVVTGVQLETVLRQLTKVKGYRDFDELPIPYRAVATDLVTGKAVVFSKGELANVMRASMSVPGAVAPAEFDGMVLVDGMLTGNLPVEVAQAMGADVIIAVNVGTPLLRRDELGNIFGVMGQMLSILTEQNVQASLAAMGPQDILISPDLGDFSTGDFDHLPEIVPKGEIAARKVSDRLSQLSLPPDEYAALRRQQLTQVEPDTRVIDKVRFDNLQRVNPVTLEPLMDTRAGKPIDQPTLDKDLRRLYGTGDFEHVAYRVLEEDDETVLAIDATEKAWGPDYLRFGLGLTSDFSGDAFFDLRGSYRQTWLNDRGAEWRTDAQIGRTTGIYSEFYQPLTAGGPLFVAPHVSLQRETIDLYEDDDRIATYDVDSGLAGLDLGSQFNRYGEARLGVLFGEYRPTLDTGPEYLSPGADEITQGAFTGQLKLDQLDSVHFPRSGWRTKLDLLKADDALGADDTYGTWMLDSTAAISMGNHTFNLGLVAADQIGSDPLPRYQYFQWGGFFRQSGYAPGQLLGDSLQYGRLMYYHRILEGSMFEGAFGGFSLEAGKIGNPLVPTNSDDWLKSGSLFMAVDSPLGPVYLGYGHAEDGNSNLYFYLGRPF
jgi:NTE family protein